MESNRDIIINRFNESIETKQAIIRNERLIVDVEAIATEISETLNRGNKLLICGNGGSASDALHFAGEIVGRFQKERRPLPAIVLNADVATLTAIANDYGYEHAFERQAKAFAEDGDAFIGITTSGNSQNVVNAIEAMNQKDITTIVLTGKDGGKCEKIAKYCFVVPSDITSHIQESHITLIHAICEIVEKNLENG